MKNIIKKTSVALGALSLYTGQAFAASGGFYDNPQGGANTPNAVTTDTLGGSVTTLINYFLGILGLIAVAFLIYAGILMVTAGGNDEQVTKAKKVITYSVIGIVVILLSWTIVRFVTLSLG